jgi:hypothetical protein
MGKVSGVIARMVMVMVGVTGLIMAGDNKAQDGNISSVKPETSRTKTDEGQSELAHVYLGYGRVTVMEWQTKWQIIKVTLGQPILKVSVDPDRARMELFPAVTEGKTNMAVTFDDGTRNGFTVIYALHIVSEEDINYRVTYSFPEEQAAANAAVPRGPPVRPSEIDVMSFARFITSFEREPQFRAAAERDVRHRAIDKVYRWNGYDIYLVDAWEFPRSDTLVLRVMRRNTTAKAQYLHASQIRLTVANKEWPKTAWMQTAAMIYPGQMDTAHLFLQGYRLTADQPWEIKLPWSSEELQTMAEAEN